MNRKIAKYASISIGAILTLAIISTNYSEAMNAGSSTKAPTAQTSSTVAVDTVNASSVAKNTTSDPLSRGGAAPIMKKTTEVKKQEVKKESPIEVLDWWKDARNVFGKGSNAEVTDIATGKTFKVQRTMGSNHADCEALSTQDSAIMKSIWGGFSWERRPVVVKINGKRLAASMSAMPHAGLDNKPAYQYVKNRSAGYGSGLNLDVIKNNGMDGHFDIHFLNSTRHMDAKKDPQHQAAIQVASRVK